MVIDRGKWNKKKYKEFVRELESMADEKYKEFHSGLAGADGCELIGIRSPQLKQIIKEVKKTNTKSFLQCCESKYYEERIIEGGIIASQKGNLEELFDLADKYADKITSWAINDSFCSMMKVVKKNKKEWFEHIKQYLNSENPWHIRLGLILMMSYFLEEEYIDEVLKRCDTVKSDHYYVKMGQAWLIATAYIKCRDNTDLYLRCENNLNKWVYNKSIQKIRESYRISKEDKDNLAKRK